MRLWVGWVEMRVARARPMPEEQPVTVCRVRGDWYGEGRRGD